MLLLSISMLIQEFFCSFILIFLLLVFVCCSKVVLSCVLIVECIEVEAWNS